MTSAPSPAAAARIQLNQARGLLFQATNEATGPVGSVEQPNPLPEGVAPAHGYAHASELAQQAVTHLDRVLVDSSRFNVLFLDRVNSARSLALAGVELIQKGEGGGRVGIGTTFATATQSIDAALGFLSSPRG